MGLRIVQRRQRRDINEAVARKAYLDLLRNPTNQAIDNYISKFTPPGGGQYKIAAADYTTARYLLAVVHCSYIEPAYSVFLDVLGYKLNNDMDQYRLEVAKLEKRMLDKRVGFETVVKGPAFNTPAPSQQVMSPSAQKGDARVRLV